MANRTSRQKIIEYLEKREVAGVSEISQVLHMTPANVRHHLSSLQDEGVVIITGQRPNPGRGRPQQIYRLSGPVGRNNLDLLSSALLRALQNIPVDDQEKLLAQLASDLAAIPEQPPKNLTQRMNATVRRLNEQHYRARWEAHSVAPRIILAHCPYASIIAKHPELCRLDAMTIEILTGQPVTQIEKLTPGPVGLPQCIFALKK